MKEYYMIVEIGYCHRNNMSEHPKHNTEQKKTDTE